MTSSVAAKYTLATQLAAFHVAKHFVSHLDIGPLVYILIIKDLSTSMDARIYIYNFIDDRTIILSEHELCRLK